MNRSINNFLTILAVLLMTACNQGSAVQKEPEKPAVSPASEKTVSQTSVPPQAPAKSLEQTQKSQPAASQPAAQVTQNKVKDQTPVERLKAWDKNLHFLKTYFIQKTSFNRVMVSASQGTLFYNQAKHALRLDTEEADGTIMQSAVTDKEKIIILDEKGKEVSRLSWKEWQQGQPNQALFDFGNYTELLNRHNVEIVRPDFLALTPQEGEPYTLYLMLSPDDYFPQGIKLVASDLVTQADLINTQLNEPLPQATFGGFF